MRLECHMKNNFIIDIEEKAEADNTLRDPHNSSDDAKAESNNCSVIHSKYTFLHRC